VRRILVKYPWTALYLAALLLLGGVGFVLTATHHPTAGPLKVNATPIAIDPAQLVLSPSDLPEYVRNSNHSGRDSNLPIHNLPTAGRIAAYQTTFNQQSSAGGYFTVTASVYATPTAADAAVIASGAAFASGRAMIWGTTGPHQANVVTISTPNDRLGGSALGYSGDQFSVVVWRHENVLLIVSATNGFPVDIMTVANRQEAKMIAQPSPSS
jgi:hypothetical protein